VRSAESSINDLWITFMYWWFHRIGFGATVAWSEIG